MEIKNIIFDFGGVLIDWSPRYLFEKLIDDEQELDYFLNNVCTLDWNLEQDRGRTIKEATESLQKEFPKYHDLIQQYYDRWPEMIKSEIHENVELLYEVKKRYPVYGLTNFSAETLPIAKKKYDFFGVFDGILCSGEDKVVKPDDEIYELLLSRFELSANECVFIDDNLDNIKAADRLGFHTIHFTPETDLSLAFKKLGVL